MQTEMQRSSKTQDTLKYDLLIFCFTLLTTYAETLS